MSRMVVCALCAAWSCVLVGCAHYTESRTVDRFSAAWHAGDVEALRASSSTSFAGKALRHKMSADDLKLLKLPEGKASVVQVADDSKTARSVTVEVGKKKRKLQYRLVRDDKSGKWVVEDVLLRQKRRGLDTSKGVAEQMDLLLTVREVLDAWESGTRSQVIDVAAPELKQTLSALPPSALAGLTNRFVGADKAASSHKPKAGLDDKTAVVTLPRASGKLVMSFEAIDGKWKLGDAVVEGAGGAVRTPSVKRTAVAMLSATRFLDAYSAGDRAVLKQVATERLFDECLSHADPTRAPLPRAADGGAQDIKLQGGRAEFIVRGSRQWTKLSLKSNDRSDDSGAPLEYRVENVSVYDATGKDERLLSTLINGPAVMQVFVEALAHGELAVLRKTSTVDLNTRVWSRLTAEELHGLPLPVSARSRPRIVSVQHDGPVSRLKVDQDGVRMEFVVRNRGGRVRVDDLLVESGGKPESLKSMLELLIPLNKFAAALESGSLDVLRENSSKDFNRVVWSRTKSVPEDARTAANYLRTRVTGVVREPARVMVKLGDGNYGAQVWLAHEYNRFAVEEIRVIAGVQPSQQAELKKTLRIQLASGTMPKRVASQEGHNADTVRGGQPLRRGADRDAEIQRRDRLPQGAKRPVAIPAHDEIPATRPTPHGGSTCIEPDESAFDVPERNAARPRLPAQSRRHDRMPVERGNTRAARDESSRYEPPSARYSDNAPTHYTGEKLRLYPDPARRD